MFFKQYIGPKVHSGLPNDFLGQSFLLCGGTYSSRSVLGLHGRRLCCRADFGRRPNLPSTCKMVEVILRPKVFIDRRQHLSRQLSFSQKSVDLKCIGRADFTRLTIPLILPKSFSSPRDFCRSEILWAELNKLWPS